jgi:hypothetical protein
VAGLALVWVGLVWTLGNVGLLDALFVLRRWWPWLLLAWGGLELLRVWSVARAEAARTTDGGRE